MCNRLEFGFEVESDFERKLILLCLVIVITPIVNVAKKSWSLEFLSRGKNMSTNSVKSHREKINKILEDLHAHQRLAANLTFAALNHDCRTVILAAEMQSGKSGIAVALACLQRNSLSDDEIVNQSMLRDTVYVLTMPNTDLLTQAKEDLKPCMNAIVTNLTHFIQDLDKYFQRKKPKLIIIDECHYGSNEDAVRYEKLFKYIENKNHDCTVVFISATPLSALLAAEAEAILRRSLKTKLVFHRASDEYRGITKMWNENQVVSLNGRARNIMNRSKERERFVKYVLNCEKSGWALIRVPSGTPMDAKKMLIKEGFEAENIFILGSKLIGVPENELIDVDQFKTEYEQGVLFGKKMIAITVAGVRAGINFGQQMKEGLIASWDSTVSSVAAIVQANIGRACGYHKNTSALHFTNISGVKAYADIVAYLEENCSSKASDDMAGLRDEFERICGAYDIRGLDAGAKVSKGGGAKVNSTIYEHKIFQTDSYLVVPANLHCDFDFSEYTDDPEYLNSISLVRNTLLKDGLKVKNSRALPAHSNCIANWVNGDTFSNAEKAAASGPISERVVRFTNLLDLDSDVLFNDVIPAGGGVKIEDKTIGVYIFSIYNESRRDVERKVMTRDEVNEVASLYGVPKDDTILVLFKKGDFSQKHTDAFIDKKNKEASASRITEVSKFQRDYS